MATYKEIQNWVQKKHDWLPKTCWIAHCKELSGLPVRKAHNRQNNMKRMVPCPPQKKAAIFAAFRHFGMID